MRLHLCEDYVWKAKKIVTNGLSTGSGHACFEHDEAGIWKHSRKVEASKCSSRELPSMDEETLDAAVSFILPCVATSRTSRSLDVAMESLFANVAYVA